MWSEITGNLSGLHAASLLPLALSEATTQWFSDNLILIIGGAIVVLGLGIFGISDLMRFSVKRIWAISGVCFDESIRRRVLWIIPLAIVGLVVIVAFQQPFDEQDAIRETTKFCLFATGMVVVISTIILACTNLPREIENRVIFTVVTKPTTRLEIVLGKITGFARVSATILLIMGVFSYGYLRFRAWGLQSDLSDRLKANNVEAISRARSEHYVNAGLLNAKTMVGPDAMNIYATQPAFNDVRREPTADGMVMIPFALPADMVAVADPEGKQYTGPGIRVHVKVGYVAIPPTTQPGKPTAAPQPPKIMLQVFDQNANSIPVEIKNSSVEVPSADGSIPVSFDINSANAAMLARYPLICMVLSNAGGDGRFWLNDDPRQPPVVLEIPVTSSAQPVTVTPSNPLDKKQGGRVIYKGRDGTTGQQVKGDPAGKSQVCIYRFLKADIDHGARKTIPIELRAGVEKAGAASDENAPTQTAISVLNTTTGKESPPVMTQPENNLPFYAEIPAEYTEGGNFSLVVRCLSDNQWLNLTHTSISIVQSENSFVFNLFKSTLIMWLLSVLVTSIAIFCSTFLSWPIAVVLTLVILLGRWGVNQLGDAATAGVGRQFVQDFGVKDPAAMHVLSESVENLNKALKAVATVLPDIEQFAATDDIDRGISIPVTTIVNSCLVLLGFGVPLTVLAYIFLKNKEVAP